VTLHELSAVNDCGEPAKKCCVSFHVVIVQESGDARTFVHCGNESLAIAPAAIEIPQAAFAMLVVRSQAA